MTLTTLVLTTLFVAPTHDVLDRYDQLHVGFADTLVENKATGAVVVSSSTPYLGKRDRLLPTDEFLRVIGRNDLADQYDSNLFRQRVALGAGATVFAAGAAGAIGAFTFAATPARNGARDANVPVLLGSSLALAIGAATASYGLFADPSPVTTAEARDLADQYNKQLAKGLGLQNLGVAPTPTGVTVAGSVSF